MDFGSLGPNFNFPIMLRASKFFCNFFAIFRRVSGLERFQMSEIRSSNVGLEGSYLRFVGLFRGNDVNSSNFCPAWLASELVVDP